MAIILRLDRIMADRKISLTELSERVGISMANLSNLKTGKVRAIRFSTLDAICRELHCQPGDILEYDETWKEPEQAHSVMRLFFRRTACLRWGDALLRKCNNPL